MYSSKYCAQTFSDKVMLLGHITSYHKRCNVCENIFPSQRDIEMHMKADQKKSIQTFTCQRTKFKESQNKKFM